MNVDSTYSKPDRPVQEAPRQVAVIDIGATSVRMQIAEIKPDESVRKLESFSQAVSLGKDSFVKRKIEKETIEDCVHVLKLYRSKLDEYGITDPRQIRVIATSGVKEAENRLAFVDRVFIATGFDVEPFDEAELHRVTYLSILPVKAQNEEVFAGDTVICEVGGGTTELLLLKQADVHYSHTFRLGSLRLRKTTQSTSLDQAQSREIMENRINQSIQQLFDATGDFTPMSYVAMGGDVRFAAAAITDQPIGDELVKISVSDLGKLTDRLLAQSPDRLAAKYHLSLPDAECLGPGLLAQHDFAKELGVTEIHVSNVNLRDGLITEMAHGRRWSESIHKQIVQSVIQLGKRFHFGEKHARCVAELSLSLFDQLSDLHRLEARYRDVLEIAALLHEIGLFISTKSYHKHTAYLIRNSEFFGIGKREIDLVALVSRYHRRATPQPSHDGYTELERHDRVAVNKLAAIIRIAKALDASRSQKIKQIKCNSIASQIQIVTDSSLDLSSEWLELKTSSGFFEDIFGRTVVLISNKS